MNENTGEQNPKKKSRRIFLAGSFVILGAAAVAGTLWFTNQNNAELDERWAASDANSDEQINNETWQLLLDDYLVSDTDSGVHLFDYAGLLDDGREPLDEYVNMLVEQNPLTLNAVEQKAYWINLYNAATVKLILDNYPLQSITTLGSSVTDFGPWNDMAVTVNNIDLSLNDIEHRIIRPLYNDYRIHFAVNCASIGCPNLSPNAFNAEELDEQLDVAAAEYLTHPRGLVIEGDELHLSTLFEWYAADFGSNQSEVLATLAKHTDETTRNALSTFNGKPNYDYDWSLNGYCSVDDECGEL